MQGRADQVKSQEQQSQGNTGGNYQPGRRADIPLPRVEDQAPGRLVGIAQPQEGQGCLGEHRLGHLEDGVGEDRPHPVGYDMPEQDAQLAPAGHVGGLDIAPPLQRQDLGAHDLRVGWPDGQAHDNNHQADGGAKEGHHQNHQERPGDDVEQLKDPAHQIVQPASDIAGERTQHNAHQQ